MQQHSFLKVYGETEMEQTKVVMTKPAYHSYSASDKKWKKMKTLIIKK